MKSVVIPNTDVRVSRIGFGAAGLHRHFSARARRALLDAAADVGVTHFDVSPYYGFGLAERDLGSFLHGRRSQFTVATKFGLYPWGGQAYSAGEVWARKALGRAVSRTALPVVDWSLDRARASLEASLRRLGTDYLDLLFLHEPDSTTVCSSACAEWLESERVRGRVRAWGVAGVAKCVEPFVSTGSVLAQVVQTRDSLAGREADFMGEHGRAMQFTYGYFSAASVDVSASWPSWSDILSRNATGAVLFSTRRSRRLDALAVVE